MTQVLNALAKRRKAEMGPESRSTLISLPFGLSSSFLCIIATVLVRIHLAASI